VIASFADAATEDIFNGRSTKAARGIPKEIWRIAARKLSTLDYATTSATSRRLATTWRS
jgi:hypothetical protein